MTYYRQNQRGQTQQYLRRVFRLPLPFFATPPASLGVPADFTAGPFFATDFLRAFFPGFGPTQISVEPQPLITNVVVSRMQLLKPLPKDEREEP